MKFLSRKGELDAIKKSQADQRTALIYVATILVVGIHLKWYDYYIVEWCLLGIFIRYWRLLPMGLYLSLLWMQPRKEKEYNAYKEYISVYL